MNKEYHLAMLRKNEPLLGEAVSQMVDYVLDRFPSTFPSKAQTEAVNEYLESVYANGDGSMSKGNCEHRRIATQNITIHAIPLLNGSQLDRLQNILDHIAYNKEYYMPEHRRGFSR